MIWNYKDSDNISHPFNCEAWKEVENTLVIPEFQKDNKFLMICIFVDEYKQQRTRNTLLTGIYMTLWNFKQVNSSHGKFVVAILPPQVKINKVIEEIIVKPCLELEKGCKFNISIKKKIYTQIFFGTLYCINGDHMGQIEICGIVGPKGQSPSIYSLTKRETFNIAIEPGKDLKIRSAQIHEKIITEIINMQVRIYAGRNSCWT